MVGKMATKAEEIADPNSTWNKVKDDEPVFILRAQDLLAPGTVCEWVANSRKRGVSSGKLREARNCVTAMMAWANRNGVKLPD